MRLPSDAEASGRRMGHPELAYVQDAILSGTLNCTRGTYVKRLETDFAALYAGGGYECTAVTSGTAAIHCALAALDLEPGGEVITTSVTDMGAIAPILSQGLVPGFADIDPFGYNVTAGTIAAALTPRTRAIIVTHLFGVPCAMEPILTLARQHNLPVIEDAAQAPYATCDGRRAGTMGSLGCFSLQQGKHMTCGEGGLVITRDPGLSRRVRLFHDKAWGYGDPEPDHYFLAPNYRMTELQGAVALAQLDRVEGVVLDRQNGAGEFLSRIEGLPGVTAQAVPAGAVPVFWKVVLRIDATLTGLDVRAVGAALKDRYGIACTPRYVQKPAFECAVFRDRRTFGSSHWPLQEWPAPSPNQFPGTYAALRDMLVLPWNENYRPEHIAYIADALRALLTPG